ncbi:MAG: AI-2E family transporter [Candidatus Aminicenantaceae bacterium]
MERLKFRRIVLIIFVIVISTIFFKMIQGFLMAILMAGIISALANPLYRRFERWYRGRRSLASISTLLIIVLLLIIPMGGLLGIVAAQAFKVGQSITPWIQQQLSDPSGLAGLLEKLPFYEQIAPYQHEILVKAGEMVGSVSQFLISGLSSVTVVTAQFLFNLFVFLYTMYFFFMDGEKLLNRILYYLPLEESDELRMLDRFTSVTRATLKGTAVIGILQGGLAGLAFAVVGIPSAVFWGTIMVVLSVIPGIGTGFVWVPAAIILAATGNMGQAIGLALFCGLVVGSLDNILRPRLVGKDTQLPDLLIFFGTLGGIFFFGVLGIIIGPIVAALFVTIWEIYGEVFKDVLPEVHHIDDQASTEEPQPEPPAPEDTLEP